MNKIGHTVNTITRLSLEQDEGGGYICEDIDGEYVRYEDMAAIVAKYKKDAERYRWLCEYRKWPEDVNAAIDIGGKSVIDAAIDNAIIETGETK